MEILAMGYKGFHTLIRYFICKRCYQRLKSGTQSYYFNFLTVQVGHSGSFHNQRQGIPWKPSEQFTHYTYFKIK